MGPSLLALHLHSPTVLSSLPPDVAHIPVHPAAFCSCARLSPCSRLSAHAGLFCSCKIPGALGKLQHCFCTAEVSLACCPVARSPLNPSSRRHVHGRLAILVLRCYIAHNQNACKGSQASHSNKKSTPAPTDNLLAMDSQSNSVDPFFPSTPLR